MYPNGQAQVMASDFGEAYHRLFEWYRFTYTRQDELHPKCLPTKDLLDRDVGQAKYRGHEEFEESRGGEGGAELRLAARRVRHQCADHLHRRVCLRE